MKQKRHNPPVPDIHDDYDRGMFELDQQIQHLLHFRARELTRVLPADVSVMVPVLEFADAVREEFGSPLVIISHFRPLTWNEGPGQSPNSQHLWARALDLRPQNGDVYGLHIAALKVSDIYNPTSYFTGVGKYSTFVHIDLSKPEMHGGRKRNSRW